MIPRLLFSRWALGATMAASASLVGLHWATRPPADSQQGEEPSCCAIDKTGSSLSTAAAPDPVPAPPAADGPPRHMTIPDAAMIDHRGRPVRFYTDLVKGRVVAINFMFTRCQTICPALGINFGQLQSLLDGQPVQLISVSLDPWNDRPAQLAEWAKRYGAGPNWTLVTGEKPEVDALLKALALTPPTSRVIRRSSSWATTARGPGAGSMGSPHQRRSRGRSAPLPWRAGESRRHRLRRLRRRRPRPRRRSTRGAAATSPTSRW